MGVPVAVPEHEPAIVPPHHGDDSIAAAAPPEEFPVFKQSWERKGEAELEAAPPIQADDDGPLPWWERQPELVSAPAPAPAVPEPPPPPPPPAPKPMTHAYAVEAPRGNAPPRTVPRPPTPGATTRPVHARSRRRPIIALGASVVVIFAMGIPLAKRWMGDAPTVTMSDPGDFPPDRLAATSQPPVRIDAARPPAHPAAATGAATVSIDQAPLPDLESSRARAETVSRRAAIAKEARRTLARREAPPARAPVAVAVVAAPITAPEPVQIAPPPPVPVEPAVSAPAGPVYEMAQVDEKPRVVSQVEPTLPEELRDRPLSDLVILRVLVSPAGRAYEVSVLRRSKAGPGLDAAVVAAIRQWTFSPARRRGQIVSCWYNVGVPLRIAGR